MGLPIKVILPFDFPKYDGGIPAAQYSGSGSAGRMLNWTAGGIWYKSKQVVKMEEKWKETSLLLETLS